MSITDILYISAFERCMSGVWYMFCLSFYWWIFFVRSLFLFFFIFFFFSSRRRHTRLTCDWSSDVCSSDLIAIENARLFAELEQRTIDLTQALERRTALGEVLRVIASSPTDLDRVLEEIRSEERRVGKECRYGWWGDEWKRKNDRRRCSGV